MSSAAWHVTRLEFDSFFRGEPGGERSPEQRLVWSLSLRMWIFLSYLAGIFSYFKGNVLNLVNYYLPQCKITLTKILSFSNSTDVEVRYFLETGWLTFKKLKKDIRTLCFETMKISTSYSLITKFDPFCL